jgi:cytochrome c1
VREPADAAYLTRAIRDPAAEIAVGYPPAMPPFPQLNDADLQALLAWLESLR